MNTVKNNSNILTPADLAEKLRIGRDKAYHLIKAPSFPSIKIGSRYIVTEQALGEWLVTNQHKQVMI